MELSLQARKVGKVEISYVINGFKNSIVIGELQPGTVIINYPF